MSALRSLATAVPILAAVANGQECCGEPTTWDLDCTDCPAGEFNDCGGYAQVEHGGCGVFGFGCYLQCIDDCPFYDYGCGCDAGEDCIDCNGIPDGGAKVDDCGVCDGDNSSCKDCAGVVNGNAKVDLCGECEGDNSDCITLKKTECFPVDGKTVDYLASFKLWCVAEGAIMSWKMEKASCPDGQKQITYRCRMLLGPRGKYGEYDSGCVHLKNQKLENLDLTQVVCEKDTEVMEGWELHNTGCTGEDMRFKVRCSEPDASYAVISELSHPTTSCKPAKDQHLQNLAFHDVSCGDYTVMGTTFIRGWRMTSNTCNDQDRRIEMECAKIDRPKPVDCVAKWTDCTHACVQLYRVTTVGAHGGKACEANDKTLRSCKGGMCSPTPEPANAVVDCEGKWSDCDEACMQTYKVTKAAANGGETCLWADGAKNECNFKIGKGACKEITTLKDLRKWCSYSVENCSVCGGQSVVKRKKSSCKVHKNKVGKCKNFNNLPAVCDRIRGCTFTSKNKKGDVVRRCKGSGKGKKGGKADLD